MNNQRPQLTKSWQPSRSMFDVQHLKESVSFSNKVLGLPMLRKLRKIVYVFASLGCKGPVPLSHCLRVHYYCLKIRRLSTTHIFLSFTSEKIGKRIISLIRKCLSVHLSFYFSLKRTFPPPFFLFVWLRIPLFRHLNFPIFVAFFFFSHTLSLPLSESFRHNFFIIIFF